MAHLQVHLFAYAFNLIILKVRAQNRVISSLNGWQTALISGGGASSGQKPVWFRNSASEGEIRSLRL